MFYTIYKQIIETLDIFSKTLGCLTIKWEKIIKRNEKELFLDQKLKLEIF